MNVIVPAFPRRDCIRTPSLPRAFLPGPVVRMVYEPPVETPFWQRMRFSRRALAYGILFFLLFAFTCSELGLVSQILHEHGNSDTNYPTKQFKNVIGLLLFASIFTLLFTLMHFWIGVATASICALIQAVFWGVGAGLIRTGTPYRGTHCTAHGFTHYPPAFQPFAGLCKKVIAIEAIAWIQWVLCIFLLVGSLAHKLRISPRATPEEMYFAVPEKSQA